eukprot:750556-Hanusia_phi.AAC.2
MTSSRLHKTSTKLFPGSLLLSLPSPISPPPPLHVLFASHLPFLISYPILSSVSYPIISPPLPSPSLLSSPLLTHHLLRKPPVIEGRLERLDLDLPRLRRQD